ncbi:hypothetical protein C6501_17860, partial [Candidatus Poribacteria bacterium]
ATLLPPLLIKSRTRLRKSVEYAIIINANINIRKCKLIFRLYYNKDNVRQPIVRPAAKPKKIIWIINPANGHAYAKIQCRDWHDAQQKAIAEGAHLVSINDEDEQFWLEVIFGSPFWIGLNDVEKEGVWVWDSGEPVTYTNWATREFPHDPSPETERDYVAIAPHNHEGGWQSAGPNSPPWRMVRQAVIEKDGLVSKIPEAAESEDE